jgi:hypothetical protein
MLDRQILRSLIFEAFKKEPDTQVVSLINAVERLAKQQDLLNSPHFLLSNEDKSQIIEICWDLITERILTPGTLQSSDRSWPLLHATPFGSTIIGESLPHYYDPDAYIKYLNSNVQGLDNVIEQYILEGLNCFKRQLFFASAVMVGTAAEKAVLLLLESMAKYVNDPQEKKEIQELLDRPRLPTILNKINTILTPLIENKVIPYTVYQGCAEHLLSLFEMIRVQRNDAVHPVVGNVNKAKVFLSLQALPAALEIVYKLIYWFDTASKKESTIREPQ